MVKQSPRLVLVFISVALLFACETNQTVDLEVTLSVTQNGRPMPQATVVIDGVDAGKTDTGGRFSQRLQRLPGQEVALTVDKQTEGYRIEPWRQSFVAKLPQGNAVERYDFEVDLKASRYATFVVVHKGEPVAGAAVRLQDNEAVATDENGEAVVPFDNAPQKGLKMTVSCSGFETWQKTIRITPGERYAISLRGKTAKPVEVVGADSGGDKATESPGKAVSTKPASGPQPATLTCAALTDYYGTPAGIPGVAIFVNGQRIGKTNSKGLLTHTIDAGADRAAKVLFSAPGYVPEKWLTTVSLQGRRSLQRYFYPVKPRPIRIGLYGYVNNSPEADLTDTLARIEEEVGGHLFAYGSLQQVPKARLREMMRKSGIDMETASTRGWSDKALGRSVDMIVTGSVTREGEGLNVETSVISADGNILLSQINRARKKEQIGHTARLIANGILDQFPFEGTITAVEGDRYTINLGKRDHRIRRGNQFRYLVAEIDRSGRLRGYRDGGLLRVVDTGDETAMAQIVDLQEQAAIAVGDRVVRRVYLEEKMEADQATATLWAKGGVFPDEKPLWGVNVYLNNTWVGTTGIDGKVKIPIGLYEEHDILLSRHGYQPLRDLISIDRDQQTREYFLQVASALFRVESAPPGAEVFVDGVSLGRTPLMEGKLVNFGFRKVKLSAGNEYRDWESVIEFNQPEVERVGVRKIVLAKDQLKLGYLAEQNGDVDAAMQAYASTEKSNPDYSECRRRLAQLLMDEKGDYDAAIKEFENVLALPENQQIIYKQFAVTYTNLGHAYYEKGNGLIMADARTAAENLAKAVEKLSIAKQNTRFFPNRHFDEAVHDTYYYSALSYHKLYLVTKRRALLDKADLAWREYFDFFPKTLAANAGFAQTRSAAEKYWSQIKDLK